MKPQLSVPEDARSAAACRIAAAIERTIRDLTDACPWPQRAVCALDLGDAASLTNDALLILAGGGC
jgi:hypothetical protein